MFLSKWLIATLALAGVPAYAMTIQAPNIAENGAVIAVSIKLDKPLLTGQRLDLLVNGELAAQIRVVEGRLSSFETRVKGSQSNTTITARVIANGSELDSASRNVALTIAATVSGSPTAVGAMKTRARNGEIKLLMDSENGFSGTLVLQDTGFRAEVSGTSLIARNPMIGVSGEFSDRVTASIDGQEQQAAAKPMVQFEKGPLAIGKRHNENGSLLAEVRKPETRASQVATTSTKKNADAAEARRLAEAAEAKRQEYANGAVVESAQQAVARITKDYDQRISTAYEQCSASKDSCDTGCTAGAAVSLLSVWAGKGAGANEASVQIQQCSDRCKEAKNSCDQQVSALEQEKKQAVAKAMGAKSASQQMASGSSSAPSTSTSGEKGKSGSSIREASKRCGDILTEFMWGPLNKDSPFAKSGWGNKYSYAQYVQYNVWARQAFVRLAQAIPDCTESDVREQMDQLKNPREYCNEYAREHHAESLDCNSGRNLVGTAAQVEADMARLIREASAAKVKSTTNQKSSATSQTLEEKACQAEIGRLITRRNDNEKLLKAGEVVRLSELTMWFIRESVAVIDRTCPNSENYRKERATNLQQYKEVQRVCDASASSPPCRPRLPGKDPVPPPPQIVKPLPPLKDKPKEDCGKPPSASAIQCLKAKCAPDELRPGANGCYFCGTRDTGRFWSACPDGRNVAQ
jgi:hypothetical protein